MMVNTDKDAAGIRAANDIQLTAADIALNLNYVGATVEVFRFAQTLTMAKKYEEAAAIYVDILRRDFILLKVS
jgi:hypothetical protein